MNRDDIINEIIFDLESIENKVLLFSEKSKYIEYSLNDMISTVDDILNSIDNE